LKLLPHVAEFVADIVRALKDKKISQAERDELLQDLMATVAAVLD
jgi:hypothetical protein